MQLLENWKARRWAKKTLEQRQRALLDQALNDPQPIGQFKPEVVDGLEDVPVGLLYQQAERLDPTKSPEAYDTKLRPDLTADSIAAQASAIRRVALARAVDQCTDVIGQRPVFSEYVTRDIAEIG